MQTYSNEQKLHKMLHSFFKPMRIGSLQLNWLDILNLFTELFQHIVDFLKAWSQKYPILRFWAGPFPLFLIYTAEATEVNVESTQVFSTHYTGNETDDGIPRSYLIASRATVAAVQWQ